HEDSGYRCPACGGTTMRAVIVGTMRTAEELGRAFPGAAVTVSGGETVHADVPAGRRIVVATPGAEPVVEGGYGAALL
ncbi:primosome assembly protein PriA, partial [Mycobacterium kansasii]